MKKTNRILHQDNWSGVFLLILLNIFTFNPLAQSTPLKTAIVHYSNTNLSWVASKFNYVFAGGNPRTYNANVGWFVYLDGYGPGTLTDMNSLKDYADSQGWITEDIYLHATQNFTSNLYPAQYQMDKFDIFEGKNGILLGNYLNANYTDKTDAAYNTTSGDVSFCQAANEIIYVGYEEPFAEMNFLLSRNAIALTAVWEYWATNSTWKTLTVTDSTLNMTQSGKVSFVPPADWARKVINSSRNKWWMRLRATAVTTGPIASRIYGDDWLNGASNLCRGWAATDGNIRNPGTILAYNPTPPSGASAKFRYQARIPFWTYQHAVANPANIQGGVRTWAAWLAYESKILMTSATPNYTGIMFDDSERQPTSEGISSISSTDFSGTWSTEILAKYSTTVQALHAWDSTKLVGANAAPYGFLTTGDFCLREYMAYAIKIYGMDIYAAGTGNESGYDNYTTNHRGFLIYADTQASFTAYGGGMVSWDLGDRGPIVCLAAHYLGANDNTYFVYYTQGGYAYSEDSGYVTDGSGNVTRWKTWFPAMAVDIGTPDPAGWNSGKRGTQWSTPIWKTATDCGDSSAGSYGIFRRDFTNAIVLIRGSEWDTNQSQFNTYSPSFVLGGIYYRLYAGGTTGPAITSIALRCGEGAILMKAPYPTQPGTGDTIPPLDPTSFTAIPGNSQISLSWVNPTASDFAGVRILRKTGSYPTSISDGTIIYTGTGTSQIDTGLTNATLYYYKAYAYDTVPNYSSGITITAIPTSTSDTTPPADPASFSATPGNSQINLSWVNSTASDFAGVQILRKTGGYPTGISDGTVIYSGTATGITDTGLTNGTIYYYKAYSYDMVPNYSSGVTVSATPIPTRDTTPPADPTSFIAVTGDSQISLTWVNPPDADFVGVLILRKTGSYPTSINDGTIVYTGTGISQIDIGLTNGTLYYYKAYAYDTAYNYSNGIGNFATPNKPRDRNTITFQLGDGGLFSATLQAGIYWRTASNYAVVPNSSLEIGDDNGGKYCQVICFPNIIGTDPAQIPAIANIISATLTYYFSDGTTGMTISAYRIIDPDNKGMWQPPANTGNSVGVSFSKRDGRPGYDIDWVSTAINKTLSNSVLIPADGTAVIPASAQYQDPIILDVTSSMQAWLNGEVNQGWWITYEGNPADANYLSSINTPDYHFRPLLTVTYAVPTTNINSYGEFTTSSDTIHWYFDTYAEATSPGTLAWSKNFNGSLGLAQITQRSGEKGKLTQVFSVPTTGWYTAKARIATDIADETKQQKVYLYLQQYTSEILISRSANQVIAPGKGGFGGAFVWKEMQISFYAQDTIIGVQLVGINPINTGITGNLYIDYVMVTPGVALATTSIAIENSGFDTGIDDWIIEPYAESGSAGSWLGYTGYLYGWQESGDKGKISQGVQVPNAGSDVLVSVLVYSGADAISYTQKVYLYLYCYDSAFSKVIESGNAILQPGRWTPNQWQQLQFGYIPLTEYNVIQIVGINPITNPAQSIYFDSIELKQD